MMWRVKVFSGTTSASLAQDVCRKLGIDPGRADLRKFSDGEVHIQLLEDVRDADVFIINATHPPMENLMEMILLADAARRSSAKRVTLVPVYLGYNRQDRKDRPRVPISARVVIDILSNSGADRALLFDLHSEVTMGFFGRNMIVDHLYASVASIPYLRTLLTSPFIVASPDKGGGPRAKAYATLLNQGDYVIFDKTRPEPGKVTRGSIKIIGDVKGRNVLLVDDLIDTAGTLIADAEAAMNADALSVYGYATHFLASGDAITRLDASPIKELVVMDSIAHPAEKLQTSRLIITMLSIAPLLADAIRRIHDGDSLSSLFLSPK
ncbi:MAG: ribose-phosphate diphosphokinase [Candidatus Kerfeldbacteria bacterium]|nr:ribose-phosphate diphosphokinase [Candidatus Kerfeldbacteria bacterium]